MNRAVRVWRCFYCVEFLNVVGQNQAGDGSLRESDANGAVDKVADLSRVDEHLAVFTRDILEERQQIDFLLVRPTERLSGLLPDDGEDRLMIELGVVEAVEQVNGAGTR